MAEVLLEAALNGDREHPAAPRRPAELAREGQAAVAAGARVLHLHPYDEAGRETLAPGPCAEALRAVRGACPGVPISLSTSAAIERDPDRRHRLILAWRELPELVTVNQGEPGSAELGRSLAARGVGIEAGLLALKDARCFLEKGAADWCVRVLVEPLEPGPTEALEMAAAIEGLLAREGIALEQVHHGDGIASWAVNRRGLAHGHGIRTGLEDTPVMPDGHEARDNGELVAAAAQLIAAGAQAGSPRA